MVQRVYLKKSPAIIILVKLLAVSPSETDACIKRHPAIRSWTARKNMAHSTPSAINRHSLLINRVGKLGYDLLIQHDSIQNKWVWV